MAGVVPGLKFVGKGWADKERKLDEHMAWVDRVQQEPVCASEMDEGKGMLKEREKEKGYPPGYLTGERETEKVLVKKNGGQMIDKNVLAKGLSKHMPQDRAERQVSELLDRGKKEGDLVEVTRQKRQGMDSIKKRAKAQAAERPRTTGS